ERELAAATARRDSITAQLSNVRNMLATLGGPAAVEGLDAEQHADAEHVEAQASQEQPVEHAADAEEEHAEESAEAEQPVGDEAEQPVDGAPEGDAEAEAQSEGETEADAEVQPEAEADEPGEDRSSGGPGKKRQHAHR
ncbi:MAG TPA: hypothetical protein VFL46_02090, partial [Phycicoccus sp.]|nr:hypothetical protein [Phycicoccus sp.]